MVRKIVAYERHDALYCAQGDLHRDHLDFLYDSHSSYNLRTICCGRIIVNRHTRDVQQILYCRRDTDTEYVGCDCPIERKLFRIKAYAGGPPFDIK